MFEELKLYALRAVTAVETWAREQLVLTGKKILSADKRLEAIEIAVRLYQSATLAVPILNATDWDDKLVREGAGLAVDFAIGQIGGVLNSISHALPVPTTTAPELPKGGLQ